MYFDRFDIVEAHYLFYSHYHSGGASEGYKRLSRITGSMHFRPSPLLAYDTLSENAQAIYDNLVRRFDRREISA